MSHISILRVALSGLLAFYLIVWQGYRLRWSLGGMGHVALILGLVGMIGPIASNQLYHAHLFNLHSLHRPELNLIRDGFSVMAVVSLYLFRLAAEKYTIRSARAWKAIASGVAVMIALVIITCTSPYKERGAFGYHWSFTHPAGAIYRVLVYTYVATMIFLVARWLISSARGQESHFRMGLRITAVGAYGLGALEIIRSIPMLIAILGGPIWFYPRMTTGIWTTIFSPLVFIGLSYPVLVGRVDAMRRWREKRETYSKLAVVWKACTTLYPEIVLPLRTLTRRRTECIDGLYKFLDGNKLPVDEAVQRPTAALREAVRRYDELHESPVADVVYRAVEEKDDPTNRRGQLRDNDPVIAMLLQLADLLNEVLARKPQPQESG
jgi:hypothetical protein